jgi:hypothetical protein
MIQVVGIFLNIKKIAIFQLFLISLSPLTLETTSKGKINKKFGISVYFYPVKNAFNLKKNEKSK